MFLKKIRRILTSDVPRAVAHAQRATLEVVVPEYVEGSICEQDVQQEGARFRGSLNRRRLGRFHRIQILRNRRFSTPIFRFDRRLPCSSRSSRWKWPDWAARKAVAAA